MLFAVVTGTARGLSERTRYYFISSLFNSAFLKTKMITIYTLPHNSIEGDIKRTIWDVLMDF